MSDDGNFMQGAYRIMVARSPEDLATQSNLIWDSGRVQSTETFDVPCDGPAASSRSRFWWSAEAWDVDGKRSSRSRPTMWETGLADPGDWSAQWLASEDTVAALDRQAGLHWIDGAERIPADGKEVKTEDADPISWTTMATYRLPLRLGRNVIGVSQARYVSYNVPGSLLAAIIRITDAKGDTRRLTSATGWKASIVAPDGWAATGFDDSAWPDAVEAKRKPLGRPIPPCICGANSMSPSPCRAPASTPPRLAATNPG